jgi:UDP-N-acetylmuramate dehydrogenase
MKDLLSYLKKNKIKFFEHQTIKPYLTIKVGGKVRLVIIAENSLILKALVCQYLVNRHRFVLLGGGSNVIFSDDFSDFVVIINRTSEIEELENKLVRVSSGLPNQQLLNWCQNHEISGMEFLAGIPGTIGGAAAVNAGAFGHSISEILEKAEIIDETGEIKTVGRAYFQFRYRNSVFKTSNQIILNIILKGSRNNKSTIKKKITANIKYRQKNHPPYLKPTAGCFFKNPQINDQRISAGKLIERSGLKGINLDNISISDIHANFIINQGDARFEEILQLEKKITGDVFSQQGIRLKREVIFISPDGKKF